MAEDIYGLIGAVQIEVLEQNGCACGDWSRVRVGPGFDPACVHGVVLEGDVTLGRVAQLAGARLCNVIVGDDCTVRNVHGCLANLELGQGVLVENVGTIACEGASSFGNGHPVAALNEAGGRELRITTETSASIAYLTVMYRARPDLIERLDAMAAAYAASCRSERAVIGAGARIRNCGELVNVAVGPGARIDGAVSLREGTVDSSAAVPTVVGAGVIAAEFIFQKGCSVRDGVVIESTLVGEATRVGKQFSAENCLLFANSEAFHSEACSIFAGPYSVTHHRSTLLIAALFSFFNAGSGTNQSNHMYKLGPVHQGILERGCKTGSSSYLLWPSRVGAFSAIMGKHYANFDTSDFPFSYVTEEDGRSTLVPGMNYFTVGTVRDGAKWPARDRRQGARKLDLIIFDVLSPYTAQKMIRGRDRLLALHAESERGQEYVSTGGVHIKRLLLKTCARYYKLVLTKYVGDVLVRRLEATGPDTALVERLAADARGGAGESEWVDVCGLLCAKNRLTALVDGVTAGQIDTMAALHDALLAVYEAYEADEWNWLVEHYAVINGRALADETPEELKAFLADWKEASLKLLNMVMNDARKEYEGATRVGFGIDGDADADFEAVRGRFDDDAFVATLNEEIAGLDVTLASVSAGL